ncbi:MAG: peptide/nickel transport system permease protein [Thermomicrobiales bacterium]|nr:peptide/nickel transport system permease protein [Thermomicrobiales bacterium]
MGAYIVRRLAQAVPGLFLITAIVFLVIYLVPGDPAMVVLGQGANEENLAAVRARLGLDEPLHVRYVTWLSHIIQGDMGQSIISRQPVLDLIKRAFPVTAYLTLFSLVIAVLIAIPTGTIAALRRNTWADMICTTWALAGVSIPSFWLGIMLIYVFSVRLRWVPIQGYVSPSEDVTASLKTMVLPALTLGVCLSGPLMRYLRSTMLQVLNQDYLVVARAKGLNERRVVMRHVLRNSFIPFITALGIQIGYLLGGAVIIEQIFALPGVGRLAVQAIGNRDFPVVQGVVLIVAFSFVLINIVVDALYSALDPRIRVGRGAS